MATSLDLLLKQIEFPRGEEFPQGNVQAVAEFFNGDDGNIPPFGIHHAVGCRRRDTGAVGKLVDLDAPFFTELCKAQRNHIFHTHAVIHLVYMVKEITQTRIRACVKMGNAYGFIGFTRGSQRSAEKYNLLADTAVLWHRMVD